MPRGVPTLLLTAGLLLGSGHAAALDELSCYQCNVTDNSQCGPHPLPCPADQAYDRCRTTLRRQDGGAIFIIKDCTLGRCHLGSGATSALGLDRCDTWRTAFECVSCCGESGCNVSSSGRSHVSVQLLIFLAVLMTAAHQL